MDSPRTREKVLVATDEAMMGRILSCLPFTSQECGYNTFYFASCGAAGSSASPHRNRKASRVLEVEVDGGGEGRGLGASSYRSLQHIAQII